MNSNNNYESTLFKILDRIFRTRNEMIFDILLDISRYLREDEFYLLKQNILEYNALVERISEYNKELSDNYIKDLVNKKINFEKVIKKQIKRSQIKYPIEKEINKIKFEEYIEFEQLKNKLEYGLFDRKIYYRGESKKYSTSLVPKIYRYGIYNEKEYFFTAQTHFPNEFYNMKNLETLSKMQHYGFPTRLLDLTGNPLVALYFACCDNEHDDGEIFIFYPDKTLSFDSDRAAMLAALSRLSPGQYKGVTDFILNNRILKSKLYEPIGNNSTSRNKDMENYVYEIAKEKPAFLSKHRMIPYDIYNSFYVVPQMTNARVVAQNGLFLINGIDKSNIRNSKLYSSIKILSSQKKKILEDLDKLKINKATLFPELSEGAYYYTNKI